VPFPLLAMMLKDNKFFCVHDASRSVVDDSHGSYCCNFLCAPMACLGGIFSVGINKITKLSACIHADFFRANCPNMSGIMPLSYIASLRSNRAG